LETSGPRSPSYVPSLFPKVFKKKLTDSNQNYNRKNSNRLKLMLNVNRLVVSNENALLIFLMKLKWGLTYSSLAVFFGIHRTTISRIFTDTLLTLRVKTKNLIFWPNKRTISALLSEAFEKNYPNCRCIIDCTEL